jgi:hypothetical protein
MLVPLLRGEGAGDRSQLGRLLRLGSPRGFATTLSGQEEDEADHVGERGDLRKGDQSPSRSTYCGQVTHADDDDPSDLPA